VLPFVRLSPLYGANPITGLLFAAPFVFFSWKALAESLRVFRPGSAERWLAWLCAALAGIFLLAFGLLLGFFWTGMRYLQDFMPALMALAVIGFWQGYAQRLRLGAPTRVYSAAALILAAISLIAPSLLAISGNIIRFQLSNPELLDALIRIFPH
jgi:hypothetical protein